MSDTDLIRYLHGELDAAEYPHVVARIAASAETAERMRVLQQREARLTSLLRTVDPNTDEIEASARRIREIVVLPRAGEFSRVDSTRVDEPVDTRPAPGHASVCEHVLTHEHWWRRVPQSFRVAAAAAAMIGVLMLVEPARAWVITNVRAVAAAIGLIDEPEIVPHTPDGAAPDPEAQTPGATARLAFPWTASEIVIDAGDVQGMITIRRGAEDRVTVEMAVTGDSENANTVVTPAGLRFEGRPGVQVDAIIVVPPSLQFVRVDSRGTRRSYAVRGEGEAVRIGL